MAGRVYCLVAHCPTLLMFSRKQVPPVSSCPGGTILCQLFIPSYFPFFQSKLFCIDQSLCFQIHVHV